MSAENPQEPSHQGFNSQQPSHQSDPQKPPQQYGQQPTQQPYQQYGQQPYQQYGQQPTQQLYQQPAFTKSAGIAIAALVVGIVAFLVGWAPVLGIVLGLTGIGLGIWALSAKQSKAFSIIGIVLASLALITSGITTSGLAGSMDELSKIPQVFTEEPPVESEAVEPPVEPEAQQPPVEPEAQEPPVEPEADTDSPESEEEESVADVEWTTIATLSGSAAQQSDTIVLTGNKVRLTYEFVQTGNVDMIVGAIYFLKEGTDLMTDGGIPEVMVTEAGTGDTLLRKKSGEYFVSVTVANASYTVTLEEQK